jgi:hypothetical protein
MPLAASVPKAALILARRGVAQVRRVLASAVGAVVSTVTTDVQTVAYVIYLALGGRSVRELVGNAVGGVLFALVPEDPVPIARGSGPPGPAGVHIPLLHLHPEPIHVNTLVQKGSL